MNKESETARDQKSDLAHLPSQLFLLRVWLSNTGESKSQEDWHGRIQHAVTGEAHYFHGCSKLAQILRSMISQSEADRTGGNIGDSEQEGEA